MRRWLRKWLYENPHWTYLIIVLVAMLLLLAGLALTGNLAYNTKECS